MRKKIESSSMLPDIDDSSSTEYVYIYRNIEEKTRIQEETGQTEIYYEADCEKIKKDIYEYIVELRNTEDRTAEIEDVLAELIFGGDEE